MIFRSVVSIVMASMLLSIPLGKALHMMLEEHKAHECALGSGDSHIHDTGHSSHECLVYSFNLQSYYEDLDICQFNVVSDPEALKTSENFNIPRSVSLHESPKRGPPLFV